MASTYSNSGRNSKRTDPELANTTFVQAEPADFRAVVQKLTGSSTDPTVQMLPITLSPRPSNGRYHSVEVGPARPAFMLQERRQMGHGNLAIQLDQNATSHGRSAFFPGKRVMDDSPVSTLDMFLARGSPRTPVQGECATSKGFYLHPSPLGTSTKAAEPELLNLFPTSPDS